MMNEQPETTYLLYRSAKKFIEKIEKYSNKNFCDEPIFKEWKEAIKIFDSLGRGYAERYEKEKNNDHSS